MHDAKPDIAPKPLPKMPNAEFPTVPPKLLPKKLTSKPDIGLKPLPKMHTAKPTVVPKQLLKMPGAKPDRTSKPLLMHNAKSTKSPQPLPKKLKDKPDITVNRIKNLTRTIQLADAYLASLEEYKKELSGLEQCERYNKESRAAKKTFWSIWTDDATPPNSVSLVTVVTIAKLSVLDKILANWPGPVSLAFYIGETDSSDLLRAMKEHPALLKRRFIELTLVTGVFKFFPSNYLRQVALQQAKSSHVLLLDVDLVPSVTLYEKLDLLREDFRDVPKVLVIPAFELLREKQKEFTFPKTKSELVSLWDAGVIQQFHGAHWSVGHRATNFTKWRTAKSIYSIEYELYFEPYIFAEKKILPNYDVRFLLPYHDKTSYFCEVQLYGINMDVIPSDFLIHYPHRSSMFHRCGMNLIYRCPNTLKRKQQLKKSGKTFSYQETLQWLKDEKLFLKPISN